MIELNSEWFVGGLAILMASLVGWNAIAFSPAIYDLRSVSAVKAKYGRKAACGLLLGIAAILLAAGVMVLSGARPDYAVPSSADEANANHKSPRYRLPTRIWPTTNQMNVKTIPRVAWIASTGMALASQEGGHG